MNVVGNISTVDVKVSWLRQTTFTLFQCITDSPAPHESLLCPSVTKHLHTLHQRDSLVSWSRRWPGFFPCLPHPSTSHLGSCSGQARGHQITPSMGNDAAISCSFRPTNAQRSARSSILPNGSSSRTSRHPSVSFNDRLPPTHRRRTHALRYRRPRSARHDRCLATSAGERSAVHLSA
jgi:hypothetical protein